MGLSIVIPTIKGREADVKRLTKALSCEDWEIIIVNDPNLTLSEKRNYGWQKANPENDILFIDDDNITKAEEVQRAWDLFKVDHKIGIVGLVACYASNPDYVCDGGSYRNPITTFTSDPYVNKKYGPKWWPFYEVDEVANAFIVKREALNQLKSFDTLRFPIDLDEADFCFRAKHKVGCKVVMASMCRVWHTCYTQSRIPDFRRPKNAYFMGRNRVLFQKKHNLSMVGIPFFVIAYVICLLLRGKNHYINHFIRGVRHGFRDTFDYPQEYRA